MDGERAITGWRRRLWHAGGLLAFTLGTIGIFLPLMPTVVFYIIAAWCFGRSNPEWEARLVRHPRFGPHIIAWRERGAIARLGKWAATVALTVSGALGLWLLAEPWRYAPAGIGLLVVLWIWSRPDA
ncbi:YbaN family protein [Sphingomonas jatrophae]|uniref:Inner membrane protein n=1 Tax=Sphingomonas jatrophae TaxID=1166337 RepID=A0A1I6L5S0_9SPHN|nr:YbaN family protein [Sphingomonas jatrophae]SFR98782.1 hypothetical protein SAMN05192580_2331 [Sphingomonas jatrophae]